MWHMTYQIEYMQKEWKMILDLFVNLIGWISSAVVSHQKYTTKDY